MARTRGSLLFLSVVAVLALVVGSGLAPASAAGLTKKAVKKIAAKVVAAQAPALSVKHATTADTATNATNATNAANAGTVGGLSAASLQTPVRQYTLSRRIGFAQDRSYDLADLPAGRYLAAYAVTVDLQANPHPIECYLTVGSDAVKRAYSTGNSLANLASCSATAAIEVPAGSTLYLHLYSDGTGHNVWPTDERPSTVTFTRVDSVVPVTVP